jgi:quinol monooxygenase YgiN
MIIITVEVNVKPEYREEAIPVALQMAQASLEKTGCLAYQFSTDLQDPNKFFLYC